MTAESQALDGTPTPSATTHRYFVSYTGQNYAGPVFGWSELSLTTPIRSGVEIKNITTYLKETHRLEHVTVLSFQRFDTEAGAA